MTTQVCRRFFLLIIGAYLLSKHTQGADQKCSVLYYIWWNGFVSIWLIKHRHTSAHTHSTIRITSTNGNNSSTTTNNKTTTWIHILWIIFDVFEHFFSAFHRNCAHVHQIDILISNDHLQWFQRKMCIWRCRFIFHFIFFSVAEEQRKWIHIQCFYLQMIEIRIYP